MIKEYKHTFHIPVMGTGFSIDTPVKVACYGISSVISIVDDTLVESMREFYSNKEGIPFLPISNETYDFRAKRFTEYLNLIDKIVREKFEKLKSSYLKNIDEINKYFDLLPDATALKNEFSSFIANNEYANKVREWLNKNLSLGSIDVNIMTKIDKPNYQKEELLPVEFNDAHASLRGFANSNLESALVLSAGLNPRLYGYLEQFDDFYPNKNGFLKKKLILKVSDYRSAIIQGKFLAKKGLWVSEYRIESGLNCGGHAFATDGYLMGPILEEFKTKKDELRKTVNQLLIDALISKNKAIPESPLELKISAQGGVGTYQEHEFLLNYYNLDSIGWGTPFLLAPEVTNVDPNTLSILVDAKENDLYLSGISPLGVPFNTVRGNTQEVDKHLLNEKGRPGSSCPKQYLLFNNEFTTKEICTASRQYQDLKIKELGTQNLSDSELIFETYKVTEKECLCVGLGNSTLHIHNIASKYKSKGVSVCPGPNLAYFNDVFTLKQIADHIYGKTNIIDRDDRLNLFVNELKIYYYYIKKKIDETKLPLSEKQSAYFHKFINNLIDGVAYYKILFNDIKFTVNYLVEDAKLELEKIEVALKDLFGSEALA